METQLTPREQLIKNISILEARISEQEKNDTKRQEVINRRNELMKQKQLYVDTCNYTVNLLKRIRQHENEKKIAAYNIIDSGMREIDAMIPASVMENAGLVVKNGKAYIVNKNTNHMISNAEGAGARAIMALIVRYIVTVNNPQLLNFLYIDEGLFAVAPGNIESLKSLLTELAKKCTIIITEQKANVTEGIADTVYEFNKESDDSPTQITKSTNG